MQQKYKLLWTFKNWPITNYFANKLYFKSWQDQYLVPPDIPGAVMIYWPDYGHPGLDFADNPQKITKIKACHQGIVVQDFDDAHAGGYGINVIIWDDEQDCATRYCHMSQNIVSVGDRVKAGEHIGFMGNTGMSTGKHLHFEFYETKDGYRKNWQNGFRGCLNPLAKDLLEWENLPKEIELV